MSVENCTPAQRIAAFEAEVAELRKAIENSGDQRPGRQGHVRKQAEVGLRNPFERG